MSWAEENGIDIDYGIEDFQEYLESMWKYGRHEDREGNFYRISEMTDKHLQNTINYFSSLDTTPPEEELKKRLEDNLI